MKSLHHAVVFLLILLAVSAAHAELKVPQSGDKAGWRQLTDMFAECSAVYNIAATLRESPEKGGATYRELANNALIAGSYSAQQIGLSDSELESIYTAKFEHWQNATKEKSQSAKLLGKAEQCMSDSLAIQNQLVDSLRGQSPRK